MGPDDSDEQPARLDEWLVPTLDGAPLRMSDSAAGKSFTTEDGAAVDPTRERDIIFLNPTSAEDEEGWWAGAALGSLGPGLFASGGRRGRPASSEVASLLVSLGSSFVPAGPPEASPATWHRALTRFLSPEGEPEDGEAAGVGRWLWKADLEESEDEAPKGGKAFVARVWVQGCDNPTELRYWIAPAREDQPSRAGWLGPPPRLEVSAPAEGLGAEAAVPDLFASVEGEDPAG